MSPAITDRKVAANVRPTEQAQPQPLKFVIESAA